MDQTPQRKLYRPIKSHQTRIIILQGARGVPEAPLVCDLHTADIVHAKFEGLQIHPKEGQGYSDDLKEYDALSYTWGAPGFEDSILCNGVNFPISRNLSEALQIIRFPDDKDRYLWVDAICINQEDDVEKAVQVWHMLEIYQKATMVIAWLGAADWDTDDNLFAVATYDDLEIPADKVLSVCAGMSYLYTRPWFTRMWVQQEVFAARTLVLQCGKYQFTKSHKLLSNPELLDRLPHIQAWSALLDMSLKDQKKKRLSQEEIRVPDEAFIQFEAIKTLGQLHQSLKCFNQFSKIDCPPPDFIDALLDTAFLKSTNPRDHIYGIIGMAHFPTKAMSIAEWMVARQHEVFIPVDYSADIPSIFCAVMWAVLMTGGMSFLAMFKAHRNFSDETHASEPGLPSWVVDWRITARLLRKRIYSEYTPPRSRRRGRPEFTVKTPENIVLSNIEDMGQIDWGWGLAPSASAPHKQFCDDNKSPAASLTKLVVRGEVHTRFFPKDDWVWERKSHHLNVPVWHLGYATLPTDFVVRLDAFALHLGSWFLLRPVGNNEYRIIGNMTCSPRIYSHLEQIREGPSPNIPVSPQGYRLCMPMEEASWKALLPAISKLSSFHEKLAGTRTFTIV